MKLLTKINKFTFISLFSFSLLLFNSCETKKPEEKVHCVKQYDGEGCNICIKGGGCTLRNCTETEENKKRAGKCLEECIKRYDKQGCNICTKAQDNYWSCTNKVCSEQDIEKANKCLKTKEIDQL